jgi:hypothetical protein
MKALVSIETVSAPLAAGLTAGNFQVDILDSTGAVVQTQSVADVTNVVTFDGLAAGDYTCSAKRLDNTGAPIADPVVQTFTIPAPVAGSSVQVPGSIIIQLQ